MNNETDMHLISNKFLRRIDFCFEIKAQINLSNQTKQ
jgi:hypothetical protein